MPETSIALSPRIDERQLDRETDKTNAALEGVGEDIPVSFDPEEMDGLTPPGMGGGGRGGGFGGAAAGAGLASRLPKPVAGVSAASALPVALAGGVGAGMARALTNASARLQTSASLLGQAWTNVWRPIGDRLDDLFIRDVAKDILDASVGFENAVRGTAGEGIVPSRSGAASRLRGGAELAGLLPGPLGDALSGAMRGVADIIAGDFSWPTLPDFDWPDLPDFDWPRLPSFRWPSLPRFRWPDLPSFRWPSLPPFSWPSSGAILGRFDAPSGSDIVNTVFGGVNVGAGMIADAVTGGGGGGGGDGGYFDLPFLQGGGRVNQTGAAVVHRGEFVGDRDRLVSELADAIGGGGGRTTTTAELDTSDMESKLDRLHQDLRRLEGALDVSVQIGGREVARAMNQTTDTDPMAGR